MEIYYKNNYGQKIDLLNFPYAIQESDLSNYAWEYEGETKISGFKMAIVEKSVKIAIAAKSEGDYKKALTCLLEVVDKDVLNTTPGRLYVNDSYLPCYFYASEKEGFFPGVPFLVNTFTIVSDKGRWVTESIEEFKADTNMSYLDNEGKRNLDFPYGFPYDFSNGDAGKLLKNDGYFDTDFKMVIYGGCSNPQVIIAGHIYEVTCQIDTGEYLTIDSATKKIYKTKINGEIVNLFNSRNRDYYIFKKISPGHNSVSWSGMFGFDITLYTERSEPSWT